MEDEARQQATDNREREKRKAERRRQDPEGAEVVERAEQATDEAAATPAPKPQRNFSDLESRIMKTSDGSSQQCYNGQAVVDEDGQVIVVAALRSIAADTPHFAPMLTQTIANAGARNGSCPTPATGPRTTTSRRSRRRSTPNGVTGRSKHNEAIPPAPRRRIQADPHRRAPKQRMARSLRPKKGRAV